MNKEFNEILTGLLIDPFLKKVTTVKVDTSDTLKSMYKHIGCNMVEVVSLTQYSDDDIWCDEEGLLKPSGEQRFFKISDLPFGHHGIIAGRGLILGNGGEGNTISCDLSIEDVTPRITWDKFTHEGMIYNADTGLFTNVEKLRRLLGDTDQKPTLLDSIKSIHVIE